jgi:hypothetical protein
VAENASVIEFNAALLKEWEVWKSLKIQDFKKFMLEHINNQIKCNQAVRHISFITKQYDLNIALDVT